MKNSIEKRFWSKVKTGRLDDCWLWKGAKTSNGYGSIHVERHAVRAHRLAFELTFGAIPVGSFVCHSCDVRLCCNPLHIFLGSAKDNTRDMVAKGRSLRGRMMEKRRGERNPRAKLNQIQVEKMRARFAKGGITKTELARRYGISESQVRGIINQKNWKVIPAIWWPGRALALARLRKRLHQVFPGVK